MKENQFLNQVQAVINSERKKRFDRNDQLSLGELIEKIEECGLISCNGKDEPKTVEYDFGTAIPTTLDSWRGSYSELALGYKLTGYDNNDDHFGKITAEDLLKELQSAIGKEYTGWKGGEFIMDEDTPIWVANPGDSGNTGIVDVMDQGYKIVLITAYCEY